METAPDRFSAAVRRRPLKKAGSSILADFINTKTTYPSAMQKTALLDLVRAVPGCEEFTMDRLNTWFARHRASLRISTASNPSRAKETSITPSTPVSPTLHASPAMQSAPHTLATSSHDILYPSLTPNSIQQLEILLSEFPDANGLVIDIWAKRLQVASADVATWIELRRATFTTPSAQATFSAFPVTDRSPMPHLPTPSESASPRVRYISLPPIAVKKEPCLSPSSSRAVTSEPMAESQLHKTHRIASPPPNRLDGLPAMARKIDGWTERPVPTDATKPIELSPSIYQIQMMEDLRQSVRLARSNPAYLGGPPQSPADFKERFKAYQSQMTAFLEKVQNGSLQHLGWDPSMARQVE